MKSLFACPAPDKAAIILLDNSTNSHNIRHITSLHFKTLLGLAKALSKLVKEADFYKKNVSVDLSEKSVEAVKLFKKYGFANFGRNLTTYKRDFTDESNIPFDLEYLDVDHFGMHRTVNDSNAKKVAVCNMYGERLAVYDNEALAKKMLEK